MGVKVGYLVNGGRRYFFPLAKARLFSTLALRIDESAKNQIGRLKKVFAL